MTCICKQCGGAFFAYPSRVRKGYGHFCSRSCSSKSKVGANANHWKGGLVPLECRICGGGFEVKQYKIRGGHSLFCSRKCQAISFRGDTPGRVVDSRGYVQVKAPGHPSATVAGSAAACRGRSICSRTDIGFQNRS